MPKKGITLSELISDVMQLKNHSNRSLAAAAGISEGAVRNLLRYGEEEGVKEPDARTLRLVAEALDIKPASLFKLAGYLPQERVDNSWRSVYVADVFDRLPPEKQDIVLGVLGALVETPEDKTKIQETRLREQKRQTLDSIPTVVREAANTLIVRYAMNSPEDVENIEPETWVVGQRWDRLDHRMQEQIIALIEHKLTLDYDPKMSIGDW
jgi:transcriptional regulator with XRE-family HTH domain